MKKYLELFRCSLKSQLTYMKAFWLQKLFLAIILFVFFNLWRIVYGDQPVISGFTITQTLWYLLVTELVELTRPSKSLSEMQSEIKDGRIAYTLGRPYNFILFKFSGCAGETLIALIPALIIGTTTAILLTGFVPITSAWQIIGGPLLVIGGIVMNTLWYLLISLLAFWTEEVRPFMWIFQKMVFVFGGLLFPLDFLPEWLQKGTKLLPFSYQAYWPAKISVAFNLEEFFQAAAGQGIYIVLLILVCTALFNKATRRVSLNGG